jgi:hypothetical protein
MQRNTSLGATKDCLLLTWCGALEWATFATPVRTIPPILSFHNTFFHVAVKICDNFTQWVSHAAIASTTVFANIECGLPNVYNAFLTQFLSYTTTYRFSWKNRFGFPVSLYRADLSKDVAVSLFTDGPTCDAKCFDKEWGFKFYLCFLNHGKHLIVQIANSSLASCCWFIGQGIQKSNLILLPTHCCLIMIMIPICL